MNDFSRNITNKETNARRLALLADSMCCYPRNQPGQHNIDEQLARLRLLPDGPIVAGTVGSWTAVITVGPSGIDEGGTIKLTQRGSTDWEEPQFANPSGSAFTSIEHKGAAVLRTAFDQKGHVRPYFWCLTVHVTEAPLEPGAEISIILGDRRHGSPGIRAQTFQEFRHEFALEVDPTNSSHTRRSAAAYVDILPADPQRLIVVAPTGVPGDRPEPRSVRGEDRWGNPVLPVQIESMSWEDSSDGRAGNGAVLSTRIEVRATCRGAALTGRSNPAVCRGPETALGLRHFWGDLHGQTGPTVGAGTEDEYFSFARDVSHLDFAGHQGNDFQISDGYWQHLVRTADRFTENDRFVVLPGYEWSGNSPVGGDRNIWYRRSQQPIFRSSTWLLTDTVRDPCAHSARQLYEHLRSTLPLSDFIIGLHAGGRFADPSRGFDPQAAHLVEVVSSWGVFEWLLFDALRHGKVGVVANSDGHKGRPGAEHPGVGEFGVRGGLTCILAKSLTRDALFDALLERRCYGTTGARMYLWAEVSGTTFGADVRCSGAVTLRYRISGTAPLDKIELFAHDRVIRTVRPSEFDSTATSNRIRVTWRGARARGRARRMPWNGSLRISFGCRFLSVNEFSFDNLDEGVTSWNEREIFFRSTTCGDADGLDIVLSNPKGQLEFTTESGHAVIDLSDILPIGAAMSRSFGALDATLTVERRPNSLQIHDLAGELTLPSFPETTPILLKVTQSDGEMAWASPFWVADCSTAAHRSVSGSE